MHVVTMHVRCTLTQLNRDYGMDFGYLDTGKDKLGYGVVIVRELSNSISLHLVLIQLTDLIPMLEIRHM